MSARRPTIADVARAAQVSPSTASVVFSGNAAVAPTTKARVLEAAAALGYRGPDPRAASLRRGRSGIVGVVFEEHLGAAFLDPVNTHMMDGLAEGVAPLGAGLLLLRDDPPPTGDAPTETTGALSLRSAPVDAVVLVGCSRRLTESLEILRARGIPVIVMEGDAGPGIPRIELDNREAQRQAASHLRTLGHSRAAIVTLPFDGRRERGILEPGDPRVPAIEVTKERLAGARDVFPDAPVHIAAASRIDEGLQAGRMILADSDARPTAVIAQSDLLAAGVIRSAEERGIRIPEDLSVTGFDGISLDGFAPYELTTLVQPSTAKGRAAGEAVVRMLEGGAGVSLRFTCEFRAGNTTGPPPSLT
ncbi:MAG: transcriptional regulator [Microbacterium sp.]|uniref:LacI family DNA-binding transcriptional regulator n=1 Tax=Microbacterium sp. TaxID=51671 RepID=UPI000DB4B559|nr:LacI family DNA-binding transcriptional regulator [Microbacterium sp.]PZU39187.1 MAG: transcriptional regulator [Microbacterium sp.]